LGYPYLLILIEAIPTGGKLTFKALDPASAERERTNNLQQSNTHLKPAAGMPGNTTKRAVVIILFYKYSELLFLP
jgi:hypothetical protein